MYHQEITPVFFFIVDGRINPVAVKVLCKVDNVLVFYLAFVGILTILFHFIERKLSYFR